MGVKRTHASELGRCLENLGRCLPQAISLSSKRTRNISTTFWTDDETKQIYTVHLG